MYNLVTTTFNYEPENVWVIAADGTDPGGDMNTGTAAVPVLGNSNWDPVINNGSQVLAGFNVNLMATIAALDDTGPEDLLCLWTFDHGWGNHPDPNFPNGYDPNAPNIYGEEHLTGWGAGQDIPDEDLAAWMSASPIGRRAYVFGQCFSGGMLDDLNVGGGTRFGCAATNHYEFSYGDDFVSAFSDAIDAGFTKSHDLFQEAFLHDPSAALGGPGGTYVHGVEHPWMAGDDIDLAVAVWVGLGAGGGTNEWTTANMTNWDNEPNIERTVRIEFDFQGDVYVNTPDCYGGYLTADYFEAIGANSYVHIVDGGHLHSRYQIVGDYRYGRFLHQGGNNTVSKDLTLGRHWGAKGVYDQSGGAVSVQGTLYLGQMVGGEGAYNLSGTGTLFAPRQYVGHEGVGAFTQTGGSNTAFDLTVAYSAGTIGTYELSGTGQLSSFMEYVGHAGTGTFTQTGGSNTASVGLYVGLQAGAVGRYELGGTGQLIANDLDIGQSGTGTFTQTGGSNTVSGGISIGGGGVAVGTYTQSGGTAQAGTLMLGVLTGAAGSYNLSGTGQLTAAHEIVSYLGNGTFTQTGGTNTVTVGLYMGYMSAGPVGIYDLSGTGQILAAAEYVGYESSGEFTHTSGTNAVTNGLSLGTCSGAEGTYALSDSGELSAGDVYVGEEGTGSFTQTGGTNTVTGSLVIGSRSGSEGTYTISSGNLHAGVLYISDQGSGTMNITGAGANITVSSLLHFGPDATFTAVPGSTIHMTGSALANESDDAAALDGLGELMLIFEGGAEDVDPVEVAGQDAGPYAAAWFDNFALHDLVLGAGAGKQGRIQLVDNFDNQDNGPDNEALYVDWLVMNAGATIDLNDLHLYYCNGGGPKELFHGDANLDGVVNDADLSLLLNGWPKAPGALGWPDGDFNGDTEVNDIDLNLLLIKWAAGGGAVEAVPEPAVAFLLVLAGAAALRRKCPAMRGG